MVTALGQQRVVPYVLDRKDQSVGSTVDKSPTRVINNFMVAAKSYETYFLGLKPDYRCQLSPDAQSTANFIRNANTEQLSANKI